MPAPPRKRSSTTTTATGGVNAAGEGRAPPRQDTSHQASHSSNNSPRRSGRIVHKGAGLFPENDKNGDQPLQMDQDSGSNSNGDSSSLSELSPSELLREKKDMGEEGVNRAIQGLARMERRLKRDVRRQKLKLEEDRAAVEQRARERERDNAAAFNPPQLAPGPAFYAQEPDSRTMDQLMTPEREKVEVEYQVSDGGLDDSDFWEEGLKEEPEALERGAARPPAVNSDYLPLPWRGRLGYACLNTYLRTANPPVFSSRTCRMSSIINHRHPLQDPSRPEHTLRNQPDKTKKADVALGLEYVQQLGLANARDIVKMLRWNEKYGIRFLRLSSDMFPFASHKEHGYKLGPFASEVLAEAGRVAAELGHRLTTHPGQFTQLGSPREEVVKAAVRDLEYHDEMLSLLRLPPQQDRDAVMVIHMGGVFGDKAATLARFRENYTRLLSPSIKARLVLENDDVSWSVHDLLPLCEELDVPLVLDFHHHNIVFDSAAGVREGTRDVAASTPLAARIRATWARKGITQKMHYSEPCAGALTPKQRRRHSARVATLPPCPPDADLMIEAKDKEQAVFELMRNFRLPGFERISDLIPHQREDEDVSPLRRKKGKGGGSKNKSCSSSGGRKRKRGEGDGENKVSEQIPQPGEEEPKCVGKKDWADNQKKEDEDEEADTEFEVLEEGKEVLPEDFAMGGPLGRVYWPPGMEAWLKPKKRAVKKKVKPVGGD